MQVDAYVVARKGMVHSSSHREHLLDPPSPHVAPTRKIPFSSPLDVAKIKVWGEEI